MDHKLVIFSAPSGSGKTTIVKHLLEQNLPLEFSISACSRGKRPNEIPDKDYYFLSIKEFKTKIDNNEFVEWEEVYKDNFYGTLKSEIERIHKNNKAVIFDVDVEGGVNLKKIFGEKAISIFIKAPSVEELRNRLVNRSSDSMEVIEKRVQKAELELTYADQFDHIVINDDLSKAKKEAFNLVHSFLNK